MKAINAAAVLRALRSRIETTQGLLTVGWHEVYALWAAYEATQNPEVLRLYGMALSAVVLTGKGEVVIGKVGKEEYELVRVGYKALDEKGDTKYPMPSPEGVSEVFKAVFGADNVQPIASHVTTPTEDKPLSDEQKHFVEFMKKAFIDPSAVETDPTKLN